MRRLARWMPFALVLSCGLTAERPAPVGITMRVPQITFDRLDDQLHLRIFPRGDLSCDASSGQVRRDGMVVSDFGGRDVRPNERCGENWETMLRPMYGVATPVDVCFSKNTPMQAIDVPAGSYIVLVEGSGQAPAAGGGTRIITLGSGCAAVDAMAGQTLDVRINMQEQAARGRCGDRMVDPDELCDEGSPTENCNNVCRFPERQVATSAGGTRRHPSVAWALDQRLVIGFDTQDDVWVKLFDAAGNPITSPAAFANDFRVDPTGTNQQQNLRVYATPTGYALGWETLERTFSDFDIEGAVINTYDVPTPSEFVINRTSMTAGQQRVNVAVAAGTTSVVWVFEDQGSNTLRVARTSASSPAAPMADAPLIPAGMMGAANATDPRIVALPSGEFVVAWTAGAAGSRDVFAARLDAMGTLMGAPVMANSQTSMDQDQPALATNGTDVVIAWRDNSRVDPMDNSESTIRWRHFSAALAPDGMDRIAPTTVEGAQSHPTAAMSRSGVVLLAWEHAMNGTIRGRLFRPDGAMVINRISGSTGDFEVDAGTTEMPRGIGPRLNPSAAFGGMNRFVVAWEDQGTRNVHLRALIE